MGTSGDGMGWLTVVDGTVGFCVLSSLANILAIDGVCKYILVTYFVVSVALLCEELLSYIAHQMAIQCTFTIADLEFVFRWFYGSLPFVLHAGNARTFIAVNLPIM